MSQSGPLRRVVRTPDAVLVGLTAMIGAGMFAVFAPAAAAAGSAMLVGLLLAGGVAFCNATASAQLAMSHPSSGGTYTFAREVMGPWWGFTAGWAFSIGKTASCAAMAMTFAAYVLPGASQVWQRGVAAGAIVALTIACSVGVVRTVRLSHILLAVVLACLTVALLAGVTSGQAASTPLAADLRPSSVLQAAGLLFFAFAGYARIATLAEEVERPEQLGRAILVSLACALALYAALAVLVTWLLGDRLPEHPDPVAAAIEVSGASWAVPLVRVAAVAACLGALLALLAGVGRTVMAMARERDLPGPLAHVHPRHRVPVRAQLVIGGLVLVVTAVMDVREAIGFSSFCVLLYYAVTNLSAMFQPREARQWPRAVHAVGLAGCVVLAVNLPPVSVAVGAGLVAMGLLVRLARR
ncbi:APC family permease [Aeromicrobium sp. CTD01-1L150]|uniref:APC family permease n=1 Tax=Aeromicrobium sp. CTD01-1L150 TaxID=3341830 RepID=UPI0035C075DC